MVVQFCVTRRCCNFGSFIAKCGKSSGPGSEDLSASILGLTGGATFMRVGKRNVSKMEEKVDKD